MKVVLVDPIVRGHHVVHAVYACQSLIAKGDEVVFIAWKPNSALAPLEGLALTMVYAGAGVDDDIGVGEHTLRGQWRMRTVIRCAVAEARRHDASVVHLLFLDWFLIGLATALFLPFLDRRGLRLYAALYWMYFERPPGERRPRIMKLKYWLERRMLRGLVSRWGVDCLFVFSDAIRRQVVARGVEPGRVEVIPDPVEVPDVVPEARPARSQLGLPEQARVFLFFGETRLDKGPDILLAALPRVKGKCTVVFVGPSYGVGESDFCAAARAVPTNVTLVWRLERIPDADVQTYFAAADCVVLPYRKLYLGTSGAMQHAAAYGRPIIVSDVGVLGDISRQHDLGVVFEAESPSALAKAIDVVVAASDEWFAHRRVVVRQYGEANDWRVFGDAMRRQFAKDHQRIENAR